MGEQIDVKELGKFFIRKDGKYNLVDALFEIADQLNNVARAIVSIPSYKPELEQIAENVGHLCGEIESNCSHHGCIDDVTKALNDIEVAIVNS